jgi:hypothetical protein
MSELMDAYWAAPPLARTMTTAIVITSVSVYLLGWLSPFWIGFHEERLFRFPPEIWRLVTNFFVSEPKIGIIMDPWFVYDYLKQVEVANPKFSAKEDVLWYLITVGSFIIVGHERSSLSLLPDTSNICPHGAISPNHRGSWNRGRLITRMPLIPEGISRGAGMVGCFG